MHDWQSLSHVRWGCKYHVVIVPKYRKKGLYPVPMKELVNRAVTEYNEEHPHSSLDFLSPNEFQRLWEMNQVNIYEPKQTEGTLKAA